MRRRPMIVLCCVAGLASSACDTGPAHGAVAPLTSSPAAPRTGAGGPPVRPAPPATVVTDVPRPPKAGSEVTIPAGVLTLGSPTGSPDRNPAREADALAISIPAFSIDALPFPNDPALPPRASISRDEASRACAEQGKRLCNELEWERACKSDANAPYPSPGDFDPALCAREPLRCASDFGVFALGTLGREWTLSHAGRADWDRMRTAVVRGAPQSADKALHRCAARDAAAGESRSETLLFRCCRGAVPSLEYPEQPDPAPFRALQLGTESARKLLATLPEAKLLATSFRLHKPSELGQALTQAGRSLQSLSPWLAAAPAFTWSPVRGEEISMLSGDSAGGAVLVAYYPQPGGTARFAGSYETKDEHTPILVAYKEDARDELLFSTCWGCGGEGGAVRLDAHGRLRFLPR